MPTEERNGSGFEVRAFPIRTVLLSFLFILGISVAVFARFGEFGRFVETAKGAEPLWMLAAIGFQILTYVSAGEVWNVAVRAAGRTLPTRTLARLAVEKLTIDQFMPSAGVAGHVGVLQAMRRFGLPASVAMESFFIDVLSYHAAYAVAVLGAFGVLAFYHDVTPVILLVLGMFAIMTVTVPAGTMLLLRNRSRVFPSWLSERRIVSRLKSAMTDVAPERVLSIAVLSEACFFQLAVFLLDGATLWSTLRAVGVHVSPGIAFTAFVIGAVAGTVSFIPGGIGTFEVAAVSTILALGVPFEGALAGTFLFRGLTLWIPLVPGSVMAHRDIVSTPDHRT